MRDSRKTDRDRGEAGSRIRRILAMLGAAALLAAASAVAEPETEDTAQTAPEFDVREAEPEPESEPEPVIIDDVIPGEDDPGSDIVFVNP